jgi:hypothetical protein
MLLLYPNGDPNSTGYYIRPTPFISITKNTNRNKMDGVGDTYSITLNGSIVTSRDGIYTSDITAPTRITSLVQELPTVIQDQKKLKENFKDGCYIEILDIEANNPILSFYADIDSINFEEGTYVDIARYSINLTANYIEYGSLTDPSKIDVHYHNSGISPTPAPSGSNTIEDFNDTWSIETDEANGTSLDNGNIIPRSYRISRNISAVGRKVYPHNKEAWQYAKEFITNNILDTGKYYTSLETFINTVTVVPSGFSGYNHIRSESVDKGAGSYSINDTWILGSGKALENFNLSINSSTDNPYVTVSIDGNIRGLSSTAASGYNTPSVNNPYDEALKKYYEITNSGQFGINCQAYKRANNAVAQNLNSQPVSISLGTNLINGEITYNLQFNNRPVNILSGVLSENITINDTYPGDIFAIIPVLGRETGPILQYIGGRTEYKRDVGIEFTLDYTDIGYGEDRNNLLMKKPSINEPLKTELLNLINELSPKNEPGIRKYFLSPPTENWNPREGRYSLNLSWTYELDQ